MSGVTLGIKEQWQKPRRTLKVLLERGCHSRARRQPEKKAVIDGRQAKAKRCLRECGQGNADNSEEFKVGIMELQEQLEVPVQVGIALQ